MELATSAETATSMCMPRYETAGMAMATVMEMEEATSLCKVAGMEVATTIETATSTSTPQYEAAELQTASVTEKATY